MQGDRSAGAAPEAGSVRGLGVCDVLRVELDPLQRAVLDRCLAARIEALEGRRTLLERSTGAGDELAEVAQELEALERIRAVLPARPRVPLVLLGPAALVTALLGDCLAEALAPLQRRLVARRPAAALTPSLAPELRSAALWIGTALDWAAVESFCFEPGVDPPRAW